MTDLYNHKPDPTPAEIRRMCELIRREWDEHRLKRALPDETAEWEVPRVKGRAEGEVE